MEDEAVARIRVTERLRLEPVRREHADDLWRLHQDDGVATWHEGRWSHDRAARYAASCEQAWANGPSKWIAYDRVDGRLGLGDPREITHRGRPFVLYSIRRPPGAPADRART